MATEGYDYDYHYSKISDLFFDGKLPQPTYSKHWYRISKTPSTIQKKVKGGETNERYEIKDKEMISSKLPKLIKYEERKNFFDYDNEEGESPTIEALYIYKFDQLPDYYEDVDIEFIDILEIDNFKEIPNFEYTGVRKINWTTEKYKITNANVTHQLFDKIIFPEVLLSNAPCSFSSKQVYDITRQYIKDNIDTRYARITSDYDFCFDVKKVVPLLEPVTFSYHNYFAKTKKQREKTHFSTKTIKEFTIFEMTDEANKYRGYTPIGAMFGDDEEDLKNKMDNWLKDLIAKINEPLELCPHCNGTGYKDEEIQKGCQ